MKGYKELKGKSKVAVRRRKIVDKEEIKEITDDQQNVVRSHQPEKSHFELQIVAKRFNVATGEPVKDEVIKADIENLNRELKNKKEQKAKIDSEVKDFEELISDLNKINKPSGGNNE